MPVTGSKRRSNVLLANLQKKEVNRLIFTWKHVLLVKNVVSRNFSLISRIFFQDGVRTTQNGQKANHVGFKWRSCQSLGWIYSYFCQKKRYWHLASSRKVRHFFREINEFTKFSKIFFFFRLQHIPTAERPSFFNMVEYYFHRACVVAEPSLFDMLHRYRKIWWNFSRFDEKFECFSFRHLVYNLT